MRNCKRCGQSLLTSPRIGYPLQTPSTVQRAHDHARAIRAGKKYMVHEPLLDTTEHGTCIQATRLYRTQVAWMGLSKWSLRIWLHRRRLATNGCPPAHRQVPAVTPPIKRLKGGYLHQSGADSPPLKTSNNRAGVQSSGGFCADVLLLATRYDGIRVYHQRTLGIYSDYGDDVRTLSPRFRYETRAKNGIGPKLLMMYEPDHRARHDLNNDVCRPS